MAALPLAMGIVPAGAEQGARQPRHAHLRLPPGRLRAAHERWHGLAPGHLPRLMDHDRGDVLWDVLQEPSAPSYANFFNQGRTTIPESWDFAGSQNHMILLQIDEWFSKGLTGIRQAPGSVGYQRIMVKPQAVGTLSHVERLLRGAARQRSRASGRRAPTACRR